MAARKPKKLPVFLDDDEPEKLLAATETYRDRLLLLVLLRCGLRNSELRHLRVEHLDFAGRRLWVREGKGARDRCLPIPKDLTRPLRGWLAGRKSGYVFPSPRCRDNEMPLSARMLQMLFKRLAVKAALPRALEPRRVRPHAFRHTSISRLLDSGANVHVVRDFAGHSSLATTDTYSHTNMRQLAEAVDAVYE
jgi:integrase/recombinase XerD